MAAKTSAKMKAAHYLCVDGPLTMLYLPWPHTKEPPRQTLPKHVPLPEAGTYVRRYNPETDTSYYQYQETPTNGPAPTATATAVVHRGTRLARPVQQVSTRPVGPEKPDTEIVAVRNPDTSFGSSRNLVEELSRSATRTYGATRR